MDKKDQAAQRIGVFLETFFTGILISNCSLGVTKDYKFMIIDNETKYNKVIDSGELIEMLEDFKSKTWDKS